MSSTKILLDLNIAFKKRVIEDTDLLTKAFAVVEDENKSTIPKL